MYVHTMHSDIVRYVMFVLCTWHLRCLPDASSYVVHSGSDASVLRSYISDDLAWVVFICHPLQRGIHWYPLMSSQCRVQCVRTYIRVCTDMHFFLHVHNSQPCPYTDDERHLCVTALMLHHTAIQGVAAFAPRLGNVTSCINVHICARQTLCKGHKHWWSIAAWHIVVGHTHCPTQVYFGHMFLLWGCEHWSPSMMWFLVRMCVANTLIVSVSTFVLCCIKKDFAFMTCPGGCVFETWWALEVILWCMPGIVQQCNIPGVVHTSSTRRTVLQPQSVCWWVAILCVFVMCVRIQQQLRQVYTEALMLLRTSYEHLHLHSASYFGIEPTLT